MKILFKIKEKKSMFKKIIDFFKSLSKENSETFYIGEMFAGFGTVVCASLAVIMDLIRRHKLKAEVAHG